MRESLEAATTASGRKSAAANFRGCFFAVPPYVLALAKRWRGHTVGRRRGFVTNRRLSPPGVWGQSPQGNARTYTTAPTRPKPAQKARDTNGAARWSVPMRSMGLR